MRIHWYSTVSRDLVKSRHTRYWQETEKDDGHRRFILVEGEDYADTLTAKRIRRIISGYKSNGTQREQLFKENITCTH